MKRHQYKIIALVLTTLFLLSGCKNTTINKQSFQKRDELIYRTIQSVGDLKPDDKQIKDWKKALENEYLILYYREDTAAVRVFDKRNGSIWDSNPESNNLNNAALSQITLSTISAKGVIKDYTSHFDSLLKNQVTFKCDDVLTVIYTFGNMKPDLSGVPSRLTNKRFIELQKRVEQKGANTKLLERRYIQGDDGVWTRKATITTDQSKKLRELFEDIGYTAQELAEDAKLAGNSITEESTGFSIPLSYRLENDSLLVSISGKDMVYPSTEIITSLSVLGYFGALKENENGYFLIPNGSGALVDTSVQNVDDFSLNIYGTDYTIPVERESGRDVHNLMPIFGISRDKNGVFAIVEDNDAVASVNVSKSGSVDRFNTVNASFAVNTVENIGLSTDSVSKFYVTSKNHYEGNTQIRYIFLSEEYHTYSGMAAVYRDYLNNNSKRKLLSKNGDIPLFLETVGAVKGEASTLGFVHKKDIALTTFENDIAILNDMNNAGLNDVRLILSGWMNGGENQNLADSVNIVSVLGGEKGILSLLKEAELKNYKVYPKILLNTFSNSDSIITKNLYASKTLGNEKSMYYVYDKLTGNALVDSSQRYLLSPVKQQEVSIKLLNDLKKKSLTTILIDDLSSTIYSDFSNKQEFLRQESLLQSEKIVSDFSDNLSELMLTAPNVNTASYSEVYTDVPLSSGSYKILKCSVPFYQMVYHGYAQYSSESLNFSADFRTNLLKCAEYGACPKFRFIYDTNSALSPDEQTQYYAASYTRWKALVIEAYKELNELLSAVKNSSMLKHTMIEDGVYCIEYDNGVSIYVNYNDIAVQVDNMKIPPMKAIKSGGEHQ